MQWNKNKSGFVLWDTVIYALLVFVGISFFVMQLKSFLQWYGAVKRDMLETCYHSSAALQMYAQGALAAQYTFPAGALISFEGFTYTKEWKRRAWKHTYKVQRGELFCEKSFQDGEGHIIKHTLYKGRCPHTYKGGATPQEWSFTYSPNPHTLWHYTIRRLAT